MPVYTYRREDGSTFDIRQKFSDDPLQIDPQTGQKVKRIVQAAGIIFKGSGFYVTDTKKANNPASPAKTTDSDNGNGSSEKTTASSSNGSTEAKSEKASTETKTTTKTAAAD